MRTTTPASTCAVMTAWGESTTSPESSTPRLTGPGMHEHLARAQAPTVDLVPGGVLAQRGHPRLAHALALHAQCVDDVGRAELCERVAHVAPERLDPARDQRRRTGDGHLRAHALKGDDVRARDARVRDVADDPDRGAVELAEALAQRVDVEQRLRRVLALAVAGVDDRGAAPFGDELRGARPRGAEHDRVGLVRAEREHGVLQRLALLDARAAGGEVDDVRGEALGGELEGAARARGGLVEEVEHHPPAQGRHLLDLAVGHLGEARRLLGDPLDARAVEILDREQVLHLSDLQRRRGDRDLVEPVELAHAHVNVLGARGRQVLADVVGANRQLAVAAIG